VQRTDSITHTEDLCTSVIFKLYFYCVLGASKDYFARLEYEKRHFTSPLGQDRKPLYSDNITKILGSLQNSEIGTNV